MSPRPERSESLLEWLLAALLALATFAAYERVRHAGFIWDDEMHLTQNPCIVGPLGLADIWTSRAARYFPLVLTTFWVEHAAWGLNPLPYHVVNVAMHAACALLLWRVLRLLGVRGALLGAALWALHPVQVESVAWVTELKNTQSCLFYLLAVLFFAKSLKGTSGHGSLHYAASLGFAALAMASKSSTVVLPVVLGLCAWWLRGRIERRDLTKLAPMALMSVAASALSLWTQHLEGANAPSWTRGIPERVADAGRVFWFYLGKLAWPHPLVFIYPRWTSDPLAVLAYAATAAMVALLLVLWLRRRGVLRPVFFALSYFLVALAPVLGLLDQYFWRYSLVGDHFQYLASMGPLALAAAGLATALAPVGRAAASAAGIALVAVLGYLSWSHSAAFLGPEALWRDTIARNPECWMAYNNLGASYLETGRPQEAADLFRKAIEARGDDAEAHLNLGNALIRLGRLRDAEAEYRAALAPDVNFDKAHNGLGDALLREGRAPEAAAEFDRALRLTPGFAEAEVNQGNALAAMGRVDEAIIHYRRAIALQPANIQAHSDLGAVLVGKGLPEEGAIEFQRALAIDPHFASALVNLGNVYLAAGRAQEASALYEKALSIAPDVAEAHSNLAAALIEMGRLDQAVAHCRRALELNPDYRPAHANLARALFKLGRLDEAETQFQQAMPAR